MAMQETETVRQGDPVKVLIRISAVLSVVMAVAAAAIVWRARERAAGPQGTDGALVLSQGENEPDYTLTPSNERRPASVLADFELTDRSGRQVTKADLLGKPTVVGFVFTHCQGPCPRVTDEMRQLQQRFAGKPVQLVTITVDPERDTPERLAVYADNYGAEKDWLFLTKDQQTIYPLIRDSFGLTVQEETGPNRKAGWEITHTTRVVHVDAAGYIRGTYNALDPVDVAQLVRALEKELDALKRAEGC